MNRIIEIEIGCCGDCPYYNWEKHKCDKGAIDEGTPRDRLFYKDCPLKWRETTENVKIKPCPFCGEREDIVYGINTGTLKGFDYVECQNCGAEIHAIHKGKCIAAIERWNRRWDND